MLFLQRRAHARKAGAARSTLLNPNQLIFNMWQQWVNALLGLWVIVIPFTGITGNAFAWTLAITGIVIAVLGVWGALESPESTTERRFQHQ